MLLLGAVGQGLGLLVIPILQAVFDIAQKAVGRQQAGGGFRIQYIQLLQLEQGFLRAFELQGADLAAAYHLENLGDKFHFAYAACAQLHIAGHTFAAHFLADLPVQPAHGFIGVEIEIFAEHKRAHQRGNIVGIRGDHAAFAPGIALPFAPLLNQVLLQRGFAQHQGAGIAVGAQAHVYAEHLPLVGDVVEQADELLPHFGEKFLIAALAFAVGVAAFGINENQVDIGGYV